DWLIEERQRLASIAPVIATPEDPTGPRLRHRLHLDSTSEVQRAYRRALQLAATSADGLLLCAGIETASEHPLTELPRATDWMHPAESDFNEDIRTALQHLALVPTGEHPRSASLQQVSVPHADLMLYLHTTPGASEA